MAYRLIGLLTYLLSPHEPPPKAADGSSGKFWVQGGVRYACDTNDLQEYCAGKATP